MAKADWIVSFKALFPGQFDPILDDSGVDVTDATIEVYLDLTMDLLPQNAVCYLSRSSMQNLLFFATAHMLTYNEVKDGYSESKTLLKNASSMGAPGLNIGFQEVAKMKGEMFATINDFFSTTAHGVQALTWLGKMSGTVGGFVV